MKNFFNVVAILMLTGCATTRQEPQVIKVPVVISCITDAPKRPEYETETIADTAPDGQKILALLRDWVKSRKYEGQLEATVEGCK